MQTGNKNPALKQVVRDQELDNVKQEKTTLAAPKLKIGHPCTVANERTNWVNSNTEKSSD